MMTTADLALRMDPIYGPISKHFLDHPKDFEKTFARAWFKLTHRDMGPKTRYLGSLVPEEDFIWQDPIPPHEGNLLSTEEIESLKSMIKNTALQAKELVKVAWASASTFRKSDFRGGANGARLLLAPQRRWDVNEPEELEKVISILQLLQEEWNQIHSAKVSMADLIVIAGAAGIEKAAALANVTLSVPVMPGRMDATPEMTDVASFAVLEPIADGFRNYEKGKYTMRPEELLIDKAQLLGLTAPEMTVLLGGLRSINCNYKKSKDGVFTTREGALTNDFFINLLSMETEWKKDEEKEGHYIGYNRQSGEKQWTATSVDLIFGSHSELRAISEVYASQDGLSAFYEDFVKAWNKVMNADRFDVKTK